MNSLTEQVRTEPAPLRVERRRGLIHFGVAQIERAEHMRSSSHQRETFSDRPELWRLNKDTKEKATDWPDNRKFRKARSDSQKGN